MNQPVGRDVFARKVSFGTNFIILLHMNMSTSVFLMIDVWTIRSVGPMNTLFQGKDLFVFLLNTKKCRAVKLLR